MSNRLPDTPTVTLSATTLLFRGPFVPPPERVTSESERDRREDEDMAGNRESVRYVDSTGVWGLFFLLAYIGAAIFFVSRAEGFWPVVLGLLQAAVWPVYLVFHALDAIVA